MACCDYLTTIILLYCTTICLSGSPPVLTTSSSILISGTASPVPSTRLLRVVSVKLKADDPDNDTISYKLSGPPPPAAYISSTTLDNATGLLTFTGVCMGCSGTTKVGVIVDDGQFYQQYILNIELTTEGTLSAKFVPKTEEGQLLRWHICLIVIAAVTLVAVIASLIMYNCCTFRAGLYEMPLKRKNKIVDQSASSESRSMNPFAKPRKQSLIVKEAVRSGAADGVPYYGTRKSAVWIPTAESDLEKTEQKDRTAPLNKGPSSRKSIAVIGRRISQDMSIFGQIPWHDISKPRKSSYPY